MNKPVVILIAISMISSIQLKAIAQDEVEFVIPMRAGWNIISAPVIPEDTDMEVIFSEIVERENLVICKNEHGQFYAPPYDFNNMQDWDFHRGYQVNLAEDDTLIITGEPVDPETPIQLLRGWNLVAYFLDRETISNEAFANIENHLIIAKNWNGSFYVPGYFVDFGLLPGEGYLVKVDEEVELVWNHW